MRSTATARPITPTDRAPCLHRARTCGATLFELLLAIAVLALAAKLALPAAGAASSSGADAVAGEVAHALRFAQREALRTGAWHTASFDTASQVLRVYRLDVSGAVAEDTTHPVLNPLDKREYRLVLGGGALRARVVSAAFQYNSGATTTSLTFGPDGAPASISGSMIKTIDPLKGEGQVVVRNGSIDRTVRVAATTGRVSW